MAREVEVSLRIPNMKVRPKDESGYPIDYAYFRFKKILSVPAIPKVGDSMQLAVASGRTFESKVVRVDWSDDRNLFIVSCQFANRSISSEEHGDLVSDPAWEMKPLME